jgi:ATPase subunit of ABC transporter with duplicated ATPase domains
MDEPTNHLDLDGILWLEGLLGAHAGAYLVVSHDRWFLEHTAERMLDLDPVHAGGFFETRGTYSAFLERKDAALHEQRRWQETLANRVRRELEWLRRGPKARTTKAQARIQEAGRLAGELASVQGRTNGGRPGSSSAPRAGGRSASSSPSTSRSASATGGCWTTRTSSSLPGRASASSARTGVASRRSSGS